MRVAFPREPVLEMGTVFVMFAGEVTLFLVFAGVESNRF